MAESVRHDRERVPGDINAWFFKETAPDELLAGAQPLRSIEDLAIDDLTREEVEFFLRAIRE